MKRSSPRRVALVNFTGLRQNWGCQATSWEWLKLINRAFPKGPLPEVALVPLLPRHADDRTIDREHGRAIGEAMLAVARDAAGHGSALALLERICRGRFGFHADAVAASDAVFFQAEGTMTGTDFVRGLRLLLLPFVAKHAWGKPVYSFNQTIFACDPWFGRVAAAAFDSFDLAGVRERISLAAAADIGMTRARLIPDAAFLARPVADARAPVARPDRFAVTGTAMYAPEAQARIFALADRIRRATGLRPLILASTGADRVLAEQAAARWRPDDHDVLPPDAGYQAVADVLRGCRFLVGGRYHLTILAASVDTPAIQLPGNSYKNEGLSALLGGLAPVHGLDEGDRIVAEARRLSDDAVAARARVRQAVAPVRAALEAAPAMLARCIAGEAIDDLAAPGLPIAAAVRREPYCAQAEAQAVTLAYSDKPGARLGKAPDADGIVAALAPACMAGDADAAAMLGQMARSYPAVAEMLMAPPQAALARAVAAFA